MAIRPRHLSTRPSSNPVSNDPAGMDFEKRQLIISPGTIPKHKASHEEGGGDEIDITGLKGISYEMVLLKEKLDLDALVDNYNSLMANERYSSNRRGFEIR